MAITYTPTTNFGLKDSLPTNDPAKVIKGAEFSTEFTAIQTAFGQAAPLASPTFTGTATFNNVTATGTVTLSSVNVNGTVTADGASLDGAVVVNESGAVVDFRVESDNNTHMLFVDGGNNRIGFNRNSPAKDFHYKFTGATDVNALLLESAGSDKYGVYLLSGFTTEMGRVGALSQDDGDLDGASIAFMDFGRELEFRTGEGASNAKVTYISKTGLLTHEKAAIFNESGGDNDFRIESNNNTHAFFLEGSSGNVGIAASSPSSTFQVGVPLTATAGIRVSGSSLNVDAGYQSAGVNGTAAAPCLILGGDPDTGFFHPASDTLAISTSGNERLRIDASGNLGIGTASPASKLSIASGDILLDNTRSIIFKDSGGVARGILQYFSDNSTYLDAPNGSTVFRNGTGNTEKMRVDSSGNALIGTTAVTGSLSNTARVTGGIFSTNNGTTSVPNATWTTLTAIPTGDAIYLVTAYLPNSGDPAGYNAVSIVTTSLTGTNLVDIKNANQVALRMSGSNFQVNHGQGTTQPINWSILRLA